MQSQIQVKPQEQHTLDREESDSGNYQVVSVWAQGMRAGEGGVCALVDPKVSRLEATLKERHGSWVELSDQVELSCCRP